MRLIDADALKLTFCKECTLYPDNCLERFGKDCDWHSIRHIEDLAPTVDAVPKDEYRKLLKAARKMHLWIFLNTADEEKAYEECELTDEMNALLGYSGKFVIEEDYYPNGERKNND